LTNVRFESLYLFLQAIASKTHITIFLSGGKRGKRLSNYSGMTFWDRSDPRLTKGRQRKEFPQPTAAETGTQIALA